MTITYCDLCGKPLEKGNTGDKVIIREFLAESCTPCAKRLINYVKSGPWKSGAK